MGILMYPMRRGHMYAHVYMQNIVIGAQPPTYTCMVYMYNINCRSVCYTVLYIAHIIKFYGACAIMCLSHNA